MTNDRTLIPRTGNPNRRVDGRERVVRTPQSSSKRLRNRDREVFIEEEKGTVDSLEIIARCQGITSYAHSIAHT